MAVSWRQIPPQDVHEGQSFLQDLQALGLAYQRLGEYNIALDYLKKEIVQDGEFVNHFT